MKFIIKDFFSKCDQIRSKLRIWSYLLKKSLMDNFIFCAVYIACGSWLSHKPSISVFPIWYTKDINWYTRYIISNATFTFWKTYYNN